MKYAFRATPEFFWGLLITAISFIALELYTQDLMAVQDWRTWAVSLGLGVIRPIAGYVIGQLNGSDETTHIDNEIRRYIGMQEVATKASTRATAADRIDALQELRILLIGKKLDI